MFIPNGIIISSRGKVGMFLLAETSGRKGYVTRRLRPAKIAPTAIFCRLPGKLSPTISAWMTPIVATLQVFIPFWKMKPPIFLLLILTMTVGNRTFPLFVPSAAKLASPSISNAPLPGTASMRGSFLKCLFPLPMPHRIALWVRLYETDGLTALMNQKQNKCKVRIFNVSGHLSGIVKCLYIAECNTDTAT